MVGNQSQFEDRNCRTCCKISLKKDLALLCIPPPRFAFKFELIKVIFF